MIRSGCRHSELVALAVRIVAPAAVASRAKESRSADFPLARGPLIATVWLRPGRNSLMIRANVFSS
jgi:hypothetical protein